MGRNPEAGEPYVAAVVNQHIRRLNVLMNEASPVNLTKSSRQANGDAQEPSQIERLPQLPVKNPIQGLTARVRQYKGRPSFMTSERQRLGCPRRIELGCER